MLKVLSLPPVAHLLGLGPSLRRRAQVTPHWRPQLCVVGAALALAWGLGGCAPVAVWQRGALADRRMQPGLSGERDALRGHVLSVREGAAGGQGSAGGGCGCD